MDTSETYIRMCDCPELQDNMPLFSKRLTSFFWAVDEGHREGFATIRGWDNITTATWSYIWLPRQDQLQEMVGQDVFHPLLYNFFMWVYKPNEYGGIYGEVNQFTSMEQLWLTFVMKERHGKVWDGEAWVRTPPPAEQ